MIMGPLGRGIRIACVLVALAFAVYVVAAATVFLPPRGGLDGPCAIASNSWSSSTSSWPPGYQCTYRNLRDEVVRVERREAGWTDEAVIAILVAAALSLAAGIAGSARGRRLLPEQSRP
ncbi:MAG: hypothetical protein U0R51_09650 [Solirubrobacterales bacterium]